jgi:hypothetical protein
MLDGREDCDGNDRQSAEQRHDQAEGTPHTLTYRSLRSETEQEMTDPAALLPALLALHKAVLAAERQSYERVHGRLSSAEFLQIVSDPLRYGWLHPLNELILALEEDEDERPPEAELLERARELLAPPKEKTPFGRRYLSLMQREPGLVLAHGEVVKQLRT